MSDEKQIQLLVSSEEFFSELVDDAGKSANLELDYLIKKYLVQLLNKYISIGNFSLKVDSKENPMLAEVLLSASNKEKSQKLDLLRNLGDLSLYVSGFFGDSLKRKIIDIDYYMEIGGSAYYSLSQEVNDEELAFVYDEFSSKFVEFVDVLTLVSQKSMVQSDADLLRLYDRYISTGSRLAEEKLMASGLLNEDLKKVTNQ